jgi:L-amino acid N-acyltransferase
MRHDSLLLSLVGSENRISEYIRHPERQIDRFSFEPLAGKFWGMATGAREPQIRIASHEDVESIRRIYNHYVTHSTTTYDEIPWTIEDARKWFSAHDAAKPVTVAELDGIIVGYGAIGSFRTRAGYRFTVEHSVYVHSDHQRRGIGSALLRDLIRRARELGYRTVIAGIDGEQQASIALHAKFGFVKVAHLPQIGFKFGRRLDVVFMQLELEPN